VDRDSAWWQSDTMEAEVNSEHPASRRKPLRGWQREARCSKAEKGPMKSRPEHCDTVYVAEK
jgi:hypothetical protein